MATGTPNAVLFRRACISAFTVYIHSLPIIWLALHCPGLALEVFAGLSGPGPTAVVDRDGAREPVAACDETAPAAGIGPGITLGAARARIPSLRVLVRDPEAERMMLQRLGSTCLAWSDHVALEPPTELLLETGGSLRLFGGVEPILAEVDERLTGLGHPAVQGVAPNPTAARVLARTGGGIVPEPDSLEHRLAPLPWTALEPDDEGKAVLRLGLDRVHGLSRAARERIPAARAERLFSDVTDLVHRAGLGQLDLDALADADTLAGLAGHRHAAHWIVDGVEASLPLFGEAKDEEPAASLRVPREGETIRADYPPAWA